LSDVFNRFSALNSSIADSSKASMSFSVSTYSANNALYYYYYDYYYYYYDTAITAIVVV